MLEKFFPVATEAFNTFQFMRLTIGLPVPAYLLWIRHSRMGVPAVEGVLSCRVEQRFARPALVGRLRPAFSELPTTTVVGFLALQSCELVLIASPSAASQFHSE